MVTVQEAMEYIDHHREKLWEQEHYELVAQALATPGSFGNHFSTATWLEDDTRRIMDHFRCHCYSSLRDDVELKSLAKITSNILVFNRTKWDMGEHWFRKGTIVYEALTMAIEALKEVKTKDEYRALIRSLALYMGKLNFYIDARFPWAQMADYYEEYLCPCCKK